LTEDKAALIDDGFEHSDLDERSKAIVAFTDVMLRAEAPSAELAAEMRRHFTTDQLVELAMGISLFHGFSKLMITLGLEPESMDTTVMPTPGQPVGA
jgi:alkylhydroperoxidase family enzyme